MRKVAPIVLSAILLSTTASADRAERDRTPAPPVPAVLGPDLVLTNSGTAGIAARETSGPDTFVIYGGPARIPEGKFQLLDGVTPDWGGGNGLPGGYGGGPGAWTPVDLTWVAPYWHRSTFNAENLNSNGSGNNALWSGIAPGDPRGEGYALLPGYGNSWFDVAMYESAPLADPSVGQEVSLDFFFNYDVWDVTWDFFSVQYELDGEWTTVMEVTGFSRDENDIFQPPGVLFNAEQEAPIVYTGNDYGGPDGDQIRIRFLITSDGGWSDQDIGGGRAGAAQVDDITLTTSQGTFTEDFEGLGPWLFDPYQTEFMGDFADVYAQLSEPDPCRDNTTPVVGFIDYGQVLRNGPNAEGQSSTGGSTSSGVDYGIPGSWVVNYDGGLSTGTFALHNQIWSPPIAWDLPGSQDDGAEIAGAKLSFDVWVDLPLGNGLFYEWSVRSDQGSGYSRWQDRGYIYYYGGSDPGGQLEVWPAWYTHEEDVTDLLVFAPQTVQIALGVQDYAEWFGFPGTAATPSPAFDNVRLAKHRLQGPALAARTSDLAQDGFPVSGTMDVSTQAGRDAMDVPFSMARDIYIGPNANVPGDSVVVDVEAMIPGTSLVDVRMFWALKTNATFEDAIRSAPVGSHDENVAAGTAGTIWTGEVRRQQSTDEHGFIISDRYFFDLPDVDFMYPGDVLHYYFRAEDSDGRVTTLPRDTSWFGEFAPGFRYDRGFRVRCLPTLDPSGSHPKILVYNAFGRRGGEDAWFYALRQQYGNEGFEYDSYTVQAPTSARGNGIGSAGAHGATVAQLAGYEIILGFFGDLHLASLPLGRGLQSDDLGLLEQWHALAGPRNVAFFGDKLAATLGSDPYLANTLGVDWMSYGDVSPWIGGQMSPVVTPNSGGSFTAYFDADFVAHGGCDDRKEFDYIQPLPGAEAGHWFVHGGSELVAASVINPLSNGTAITFPFGLHSVEGTASRATGLPANTELLREVLGLFDANFPVPPVAVPQLHRVELSVAPNPANPMTLVSFTAVPGSRGSVRVFNLRGELVRTLHSGEFVTQEFRWDGADSRGAPVGSGVYLIRATDGSTTQTTKVALVK